MILGSHNSMSYLPVKQWYLKPFYWVGRCQSKDIEEQYKTGVKLFDFRIRFEENNAPVFAHGPMKFKGDVYEYLTMLNKIAESPVYCRIILESNSPMKNQEKQEELFIEFCKNLSNYPNIIPFGGRRKYDWSILYNFGTKEPVLDDKYSSTTNIFGGPINKWTAKIDDIWPWLYAKTHNKRLLKYGTDKDVLFIDFV